MRGFLAIVLLCGLAAGPAVAGTISYQGQLQQGATPFNGTARMIFGLAVDDQAAPFETLDPIDVQVSEGLFRVELEFSASAFNESPRWLVISVDGVDLSPRQKITAVPFALNDGTNDGGAAWTVSGSNISYQGGNVGIGTNNPQRPLQVSGSVIFGLPTNTAGVGNSFVAGGLPFSPNSASGQSTFVGGGWRNSTTGNASFIGAGQDNSVTGGNSFLGGGRQNKASGGDSVVLGGLLNEASGSRSVVGGGESNIGSGFRSTVSGGWSNIASHDGSTVGGGLSNTASAITSTVAGGEENIASGFRSTVSGGAFNTAGVEASTVGGGRANTASNFVSTVAGGLNNTASGFYSSVGGGRSNCAGARYSWAGGNRAKVRPGSASGSAGSGCSGIGAVSQFGDQGTFVWADSQVKDFVSTASNQFLIRASGGVGIGTSNPGSFQLAVNGSAGKTGGGSWSTFSDARLKQNIQPLRDAGASFLDRLMSLSGYTFEYTNEAIDKHLGLPGEQIGLLAQEVLGVFPDWVDEDSEGYLYVTERATTAIMVEALRELRELHDTQVAELRNENTGLKADLRALANKASELRKEVAVLNIQSGQVRELERRLAVMEARERENDGLRARLAALEAVLLNHGQIARTER